MERTVKFNFRGKEIKMCFTAGVMFDLADEYETTDFYTFLKEQKGREKIKPIISAAHAMSAECGEGIDTSELTVLETLVLKEAVYRAMNLAFARDIQPEDEDEVLAEIKKKEGNFSQEDTSSS